MASQRTPAYFRQCAREYDGSAPLWLARLALGRDGSDLRNCPIAIGLLFIVSGLRAWKFLVDPPESTWSGWQQALLRSVVPLGHMRWVTALIGVLYVVIGVMV